MMTSQIDEINAKILKDLLKDGRKSFVEIAEECKTSKDVIAKRYKQMQSKGIVVGATILNSPACYDGNLLVWCYIFAQPNSAEKVLPLALKIPQVITVYPVGIKPSLAAVVVLKNIHELDHVKQSLKMLPFVVGLETQVLTGIRNNPDNLSVLIPAKDSEVPKHIDEESKAKSGVKINRKIDGIDKKIIERLLINSRVPFNRVAVDLGLSTDTIVRRYEKLVRNGDLRVVIQVNPTKIGYKAFVIFSINCSQDNLPMIDSLAEIPDVNFVHKTSGKFDYVVSLMVKDVEQLLAVQEKITSIAGLSGMETSIGRIFGVWPLPGEFISNKNLYSKNRENAGAIAT